jgi:putative hemolysin
MICSLVSSRTGLLYGEKCRQDGENVEIQAKIPGHSGKGGNEKVTGYSATGISRLCPAAVHRADENHRHGQPAAVYCQQSGGTRVPVQTPQGVSTQCKLPSGETLDEWALWRRDHPAKS